MHNLSVRSIALWLPRLLGLMMVVFLALFASDAFHGDAGIGTKVIDLFLHLIPAFGCAAVVWMAWRREWIGAVAFGLLALAYAIWAWPRADWIMVISGPMIAIAALQSWAWRIRLSAEGS